MVNGRNYMANHQVAPQILQGTPNYNVEVSEGQNPPGEFYPAGYLPTVISENRLFGSAFVLMPGKVISFDTSGRLVPAGFSIDKAAVSGSRSIKYTKDDETYGVVAPNGSFAVSGDEVLTAMEGASIGITDPIGIMRYSSLMAPGSDPSNPATFYKHSYDTGGAKAFSRWCYIQVPVVEVNPRKETIPTGVATHRIQLYPGTALTIKDNGNVTLFTAGGSKKAIANMLTPAAGATADQYAMVGRTIMFNGPTGAGWTVTYTPQIDLPFTCLKYDKGATIVDGVSAAPSDLIGQEVGFNIKSDFQLWGTGIADSTRVGRILTVKNGSNQDLALVRTYFRDFGLWQEQPGYATDGRNTQLSIANAPKYIARIAVQFNAPLSIDKQAIKAYCDTLYAPKP